VSDLQYVVLAVLVFVILYQTLALKKARKRVIEAEHCVSDLREMVVDLDNTILNLERERSTVEQVIVRFEERVEELNNALKEQGIEIDLEEKRDETR